MKTLDQTTKPLPPGQIEINDFPRFGLLQYANRLKKHYGPIELAISGDLKQPAVITAQQLETLHRVNQSSDFHCVTSWSKRDLQWSGVRFEDFYQNIVLSEIQPSKEINWVIFRCQDGFRGIMKLSDLLSEDVLLADYLDGKPLSPKHGAPVRLIAPAHYGFKSAKHLKTIEFWEDDTHFKPVSWRFMHHPSPNVSWQCRILGKSQRSRLFDHPKSIAVAMVTGGSGKLVVEICSKTA